MSNRELLEQSLLYFADPGSRDKYFALYADEIVLHGYTGVKPGLSAVKAFYNAFWSAFPDAQVTAEEIIEDGDRLAVRYVIKGTHRGPFMEMAPTGKPIELPGISMLRFRNGQCVERWTCSDSLILQQQIRPEAGN